MMEHSQESTMTGLKKLLTNLSLLNLLLEAATATCVVMVNLLGRLACLSRCCQLFPSPTTSLKQVGPWQN